MKRNRRRIPIDKKLKAKWEHKLKASDFEDIEFTTRTGDRELVNYASNSYRGASPLEREAKLAYFLECSSMVAQTKFKDKVEKTIMELFCDGFSRQEIKKILSKKRISRHRTTIESVIKRYLIIYGLSNYGE